MSNVTPIRPSKEKGVLIVEYTSGKVESIVCDEFNTSEGIPGFIELWLLDPEKFVCLINTNTIQKIESRTLRETDD